MIASRRHRKNINDDTTAMRVCCIGIYARNTNYKVLKSEIKKIWAMRNVIVVPVIVRALESTTKKSDE